MHGLCNARGPCALNSASPEYCFADAVQKYRLQEGSRTTRHKSKEELPMKQNKIVINTP